MMFSVDAIGAIGTSVFGNLEARPDGQILSVCHKAHKDIGG
jgi:hypothetical protein